MRLCNCHRISCFLVAILFSCSLRGFAQNLNDAGVTSIDSPLTICSAGSMGVVVKLKNYGRNQISSVQVNWTVNGTAQSPVSYSGLIDTVNGFGSNSVRLALGSAFIPFTATQIRAWTSLPNAGIDGSNNNDTCQVTRYPSMSGTYTIGSGYDFASFTSAVNALKQRGVCTPVIFYVSPGTYIEQVVIDTTILGSSAINTITFEGTSASSRVLSFAATSAAAKYTLLLKNTSYIQVRNLTIRSTGNDYGVPLIMAGNPTLRNIQVKHCVIDVAGSTAPASSSTDFAGIFICSTSFTAYYGSGCDLDHAEIDSNTINNGFSGILHAGVSGYFSAANKFRNNIINNPFHYGISLTLESYPSVSGNMIRMRNGNPYSTGIVLLSCGGGNGLNASLDLRSNKITYPGSCGISINNCAGVQGLKGLIGNNIVGGGFQNPDAQGIYVNNSSFLMFHHNSVNLDRQATSFASSAALVIAGSTFYTNISAINNIFSVKGVTAGLPVYAASTLLDTLDYNQYYKQDVSAGLIFIDSVLSPSNFKRANRFNTNSVFYRPAFTDSVNLQLNPADSACWASNGRGTHAAYVHLDCLGNSRPQSLASGVPDLGAIEVLPAVLPPLAVASPATPAAGATQTFTFAEDTVAKIGWAGSSVVPTSINVRQYTGTQPPSPNGAAYEYFYVDASAVGSGTYNYDFKLYYKDPWRGTVPHESLLKLAKKTGSAPWFSYTGSASSVDSLANTISTNGLNSFSLFTGTSDNSPLPLVWIDFGAALRANVVDLYWSTAAEQNTSMFELERMTDLNQHWDLLGNIPASGTSKSVQNYAFTDSNLPDAGLLAYRLKIIDTDGKFSYSKILHVQRRRSTADFEALVYPVPASDKLYLRTDLVEAGEIHLQLRDLQGQLLLDDTRHLEKGSQLSEIGNFSALKVGVYFLSVKSGQDERLLKVVKE